MRKERVTDGTSSGLVSAGLPYSVGLHRKIVLNACVPTSLSGR